MGLVAAGSVATRPDPDPWYLWPCNVRTWALWGRVQTQWRTGMAGATGLDYTAVWAVLDHSTVPARKRKEAFEALCAMERAALDEWAKRRPSDTQAK